MSDHNSPVNINARSLQCLREGKYDEASTMLFHALEQIKQSILSGSTSAETKGSSLQESVGSDFWVESVKVSELRSGDDAILSFYPCAFSLPPLATTETEKTIALMATLYNLGLVRHLESLQTPGTALSRTLQTQAGTLYDSALQVATPPDRRLVLPHCKLPHVGGHQ